MLTYYRDLVFKSCRFFLRQRQCAKRNLNGHALILGLRGPMCIFLHRRKYPIVLFLPVSRHARREIFDVRQNTNVAGVLKSRGNVLAHPCCARAANPHRLLPDSAIQSPLFQRNFERSVLGYIKADVCKPVLIVQHFS